VGRPTTTAGRMPGRPGKRAILLHFAETGAMSTAAAEARERVNERASASSARTPSARQPTRSRHSVDQPGVRPDGPERGRIGCRQSGAVGTAITAFACRADRHRLLLSTETRVIWSSGTSHFFADAPRAESSQVMSRAFATAISAGPPSRRAGGSPSC
jgi:hypothetical protein